MTVVECWLGCFFFCQHACHQEFSSPPFYVDILERLCLEDFVETSDLRFESIIFNGHLLNESMLTTNECFVH